MRHRSFFIDCKYLLLQNNLVNQSIALQNCIYYWSIGDWILPFALGSVFDERNMGKNEENIFSSTQSQFV